MNKIIQILKRGGVIAHPADTCFGLAGDAMSPTSLEKIQSIKGRDGKKPMSIMLPDTNMGELSSYGVFSDYAKQLAEVLFPGPVTLLVRKGPAIPAHYFPKTDLIGIRVPDHEPTQQILRAFDGPLITTSANLSGKPICFTDVEVRAQFNNVPTQPNAILEGVCDQHTKASTVILVKDKDFEILREGPLNRDDILKALR